MGFLFAAKVPQEIAHKRVLKDCDEEFKVFLTTMEALGEKLGPLLFQFGKSTRPFFGLRCLPAYGYTFS